MRFPSRLAAVTLVLGAPLFACSSSHPANGYEQAGPPGETTNNGGTSGAGTGGPSASPPPTATPGAPGDPAPVSGGSATSGSGSGTASGGGDGGVSLAGILTAGVWDDSLNFDFFSAYLGKRQGIAGDPGFTSSDYTAAHAASQQRSAHAVVDVALVIDTTGSMGDEIQYLTSEFAAISGAIASAYPNSSQRWALVTYRDTPDTDPDDDYVVKSVDFTSDMTAFANTVGIQKAANGGDYPESPELGLQQMGQLTWRTDPSVAKLAFWVGDAPHHAERAAGMKQAIVQTQQSGIHLYPVSASGTDDLLELTMRSAAELTGGRYLFLTNDSGVGDPHKVPEIPCYYVTRLEHALVRVIGMELSGSYIGPNTADVIRAAGSPDAKGTCVVPTGDDDAGTDAGTVQIF